MITKIITMIGAVTLLIITTLLDVAFQRFGKLNQGVDHGFYPIIPFGTEIAVYIILTTIFFLLAWVVLYHNSRSFLIVSLFVIIGAFTLFSMTFTGYFFWESVFISTTPAWYSDSVASNFSFTRISSAVILVLGLARLLPNKKLWSNPEE